ncbi:choice-of-anchor L domain-containing protein, partial [Microcystis sp. M045S2]|uniref:choice-of-anchor L domain-containing protein n=1 Tax=Microcystis sp. M045S2 TaxID=2771167 RepID=UPI00258FEA01
FAQSDGFWANLETAFGTSYDVVKATELRQQWKSRNFSQLPPIEVLSDEVLGTANGAYASSTNKIYLSASFLNTASPAAIVNVILEEIGHYVDAQVNQVDSAGDEGAIFANLVSGESLSSQQLQVLKLENDTAIVEIDGQQIQIEQSSLTTTDLNSVTATNLVTTLVGSGVTVSSISFTGANVAAGLFSGGLAAGLGINEGVVLSSGNIALATGPNNSNFAGADNFQLGDTDLNNIVTPNTTNDAAVLQFNFIPLSSTISFAFVFASEEYPEFVGSAFNDVFAFFVNGQNIALIPGTTTPVSINNVSPVTNSTFFISNTGGTFDNQFDGFTTVLSATANDLAPGIPARIKLAIADATDLIYDSAVFIQAGSFGNPTIVTVTATDANAGEGTPVNPGTFTISRTGSTASPLTVTYSISGTASSSDYNALPTSITIPAGQAATTITVTPIDDTVTEGNETVILSLTDTISYDLGTPNSATIVIADNEVQSVNVTLSVSPASVLEDGTQNLVYTFTRTGSTANPLTVNFTVGGGAAFNTDYTQTGANTFSGTTGTVIFAANSSTATVTIDPTLDTTVEPNETVALTLASGTGYTVGTATAVTGTIIDDDQSITLGVNPSSVTEDGTANLVYTFTRTGVTTNALTVNYTVGGTATFSTDYTQTGAASYTATTGTVNFVAGSSTATVTVDPTADTTVESDETVALTLASGTGYTVGTTTAVTGTITNDDTNVTLAVSPSSVNEDGTANLVYTFTRTGVTTNALTVNYTVGGTATFSTDYTQTGAATFTSATGTVNFVAGSSTATVTVDPTADTTVESDETVALTLASGTGYTVGTTTAVTGTITNDDTNVTLAVSPSSVNEDGTTNLVYTFTRPGSPTSALTANYTVGGTATFSTDYTQTGAATFTS